MRLVNATKGMLCAYIATNLHIYIYIEILYLDVRLKIYVLTENIQLLTIT